MSRIQCPKCSEPIKTPEVVGEDGWTLRCKHCRATIVVPFNKATRIAKHSQSKLNVDLASPDQPDDNSVATDLKPVIPNRNKRKSKRSGFPWLLATMILAFCALVASAWAFRQYANRLNADEVSIKMILLCYQQFLLWVT